MLKKIFISYPSQQLEFAEKIKADLESNGFKVWLDKVALRHAVIWTQDLTDAIGKNDCVLLLWSANAKMSENVQKEIITARALLKPIIPFLIEGEKEFPPLPQEIRFIQGIVRERYDDALKALFIRLRDDELVKREYPIVTKNLFVPHNRNQYFFGRQRELVKLFNDLCGFWGEKSRNNPCAITGLAGIGKTELANEFAYRFSMLFPKGIYWIDADKDDLASEFVKLASYPELNLQQLTDESNFNFAKRVLRRLSNLPGSLLILDGLSSAKAYKEWCPQGGQACAVLITTRHLLHVGRVQLLQLKELDIDSALQLLTSRRQDILENQQEMEAAKQVCMRIGNYPLALEVFASHLASDQLESAQSFHRRLQGIPFLTKQTNLEGTFYTYLEEQQNLFNLFNVIYAKLERKRVDPYFFLMSAFAPDASVNFDLIEGAFGKPEECRIAMGLLKSISFASFDQQKRLILHPLIISFGREVQDEQSRHSTQKRFVSIMANFVQMHSDVKDIAMVLPEVSHIELAIKTAGDNSFISELKILYRNYAKYLGIRSEFNRQLECLEKAAELHQQDEAENLAEIAGLKIEIGRVLRIKGDFDGAKSHFQEALRAFQQLGAEHAEVANALNELGGIAHELGNFDQALEHYEHAYAINRKYYREDEPHMTRLAQAKARLRFQMGDFDGAQAEFDKVLQLKKNYYATGFKDHPDIASCYVEMSDLALQRADYQAALRSLRIATRIYKKTIGREHKDNAEIAQIHEKLGRICLEQAKYDRALLCFNRSLAINQRIFPEKHPTLANLYAQISHVYRRKGEFDTALEYVRSSLEMKKALFGETHPGVAETQEVLVKIYHHQCRFDEAMAVLQQTLLIREKALGEKHPLVGNTLHDFGSYYLRKGEYDTALSYFERAGEITRGFFGEHHPEYIERAINLANGYFQKNEYTQALAQLEKVRTLIPKVFGDRDHPLVARMLLGFSEVHRRLGHFEKALEYIRASYEMKKRIYGDLHPSVAEAMEVLVRAYYHLYQFDKAKPLLEQTLQIRQKNYGSKHPLVGNTLHDFGSYHLRRGEYDAALGYFQQACQITREVFGERHPDYVERSINLAQAYYQKNDYVRALAQLEETRAVVEQEFGDTPHPYTARMLLLFSEVHRRLGMFDRALAYVNASLEMKRQLYSESHPSIADALEVLVRIHYHLCQFEEAQATLEKVLQIRRIAYGEKHPLVGATLHDFGSYYLRKGDYDNAIAYFQKALDISQSSFWEPHPDHIERTVNLADAFYQKNEYGQALDQLQQAEKLVHAILSDVPHPLTARMQLSFAEVYRRLGDFDRALQYATQSREMKKRVYGGAHPSVADALEVMARIYHHQYKLEQARAILAETLAIRTKAYRHEHPLVGNTLNDFGLYYLRLGRVGTPGGEADTAIACFQQALRINLAVFGENHPDSVDRMVSLASAYRQSGNNDRALDLLKKVETTTEQLFKRNNHPVAARAYLELSHAHRKRGDFKEAERYIVKSISMKESLYGKSHPSLAESLQAKAKLQIQSHSYALANETLNSCLNMKIKAYTGSHPEVASTLNEIGCLLTAQEKYQEALQKHQEAYDMKKSFYGEDHPELGKIHLDMGIAYRHLFPRAGALDAAMEHLERAFNVDNSFFEPDHPYLARVILEMGATLLWRKDYESARKRLESALEIYERIKNQDLLQWALGMEYMAMSYLEEGIPEAALSHLKNAFRKRREIYAGSHPALAKTLLLEGKAYQRLGKSAEAKQKLEEAQRMCREASAVETTLYRTIQEEYKKLSNLGKMGNR